MQTRLFGFELLPAPYVISHLQLGLLLQRFGAPLAEGTGERAAVYLTNALTGWLPTRDPKQLIFSELQAERDAANKVKQQNRILVILGNPPYDGFAGMAMSEERDLTEAYREVQTAGCPKPQGQGLNDLYVRFCRMAERQIIDKTGQGIICYISNYSWLEGLSHPGMRERYFHVFDEITIDCLNGDKYKTGKLTPEGESDPSIFSVETNREGIQVGTAIATLVKKETQEGHMSSVTSEENTHVKARQAIVRFRHFWAKNKRDELLQSLSLPEDKSYGRIMPLTALGYTFVPTTIGVGYLKWPRLSELLPTSYPGVQTRQDNLVTSDEVRQFTDIARRIAAVRFLESELNENYMSVKSSNTDSLGNK